MLGIIIDKDLSFISHVSSLVRRGGFKLHLVKRARKLLPRSLMTTVVHTTILYPIVYAIQSWGPCLTGKSWGKLQVLQNHAARSIFGASSFEHATPYREELGWIPIQQLALVKLYLLAFAASNGKLGMLFKNFFHQMNHGYATRGKSKHFLQPFAEKFTRKGFAFTGPKLLNQVTDITQEEPQKLRQELLAKIRNGKLKLALLSDT